MKRVVVLFSGRGSNFENLVRMLHKKRFGDMQVEIVGCISNKPEAYGVRAASTLGIPCEIVDSTLFKKREDFDRKLVEAVRSFSPDLTVLAGFMRILTDIFTQEIKAVNIHPSMLPHFKGANAVKNSFEAASHTGVSVHWVTNELDGGEVIAQQEVEIKACDTFDTFEQRVHEAEYELYPLAVLEALKK